MRGKAVQTVDISKHDWKEEPYRLDPNRGYLLCRPCWDGQHFDPPYKDASGTPRGCRPEFQDRKRKPKFTGEGQTSLLSDDVIQIGPNS